MPLKAFHSQNRLLVPERIDFIHMPATLTQQDIENPRGSFPLYTDLMLSAGRGGALPNNADTGMLELVGERVDQPISGSLQNLCRAGQPFPVEDYYRASSGRGTSGYAAILTLSAGEVNLRPVVEIAQGIGIVNASAYVPTATAKVMASFAGRVESMSGDAARVLLVNERTGERMESRCDAEVLHDNGIAMGDEFRFEVIRARGTTATRFSKLGPKPVPKEVLDEIRASYADRWSF